MEGTSAPQPPPKAGQHFQERKRLEDEVRVDVTYQSRDPKVGERLEGDIQGWGGGGGGSLAEGEAGADGGAEEVKSEQTPPSSPFKSDPKRRGSAPRGVKSRPLATPPAPRGLPSALKPPTGSTRSPHKEMLPEAGDSHCPPVASSIRGQRASAQKVRLVVQKEIEMYSRKRKSPIVGDKGETVAGRSSASEAGSSPLKKNKSPPPPLPPPLPPVNHELLATESGANSDSQESMCCETGSAAVSASAPGLSTPGSGPSGVISTGSQSKGKKRPPKRSRRRPGGSSTSSSRCSTPDSGSPGISIPATGEKIEGRPRREMPLREGMLFKIGARLEACDASGKWYPAKIIAVDEENCDILIHFERWSSRYDQWLSMESDMLRPPTKPKPPTIRGEGDSATGADLLLSPAIEPSLPLEERTRTEQGFRVGDQVLARWSDHKKYPGKIGNIFSDGNLYIVFYDGYRKKVRPHHIEKLPPDYQGSWIPPPPGQGCASSTVTIPAAPASALVLKTTPGPSASDLVQAMAGPAPEPAALNAFPLLPSAPFALPVAIKEFKIEADHNHFKCEVDGCGKSFRKEKLLQSHVKHYHPEIAAKISSRPCSPIPPSPEPIVKVAEVADIPSFPEAKSTQRIVKPVPVKVDQGPEESKKKSTKEKKTSRDSLNISMETADCSSAKKKKPSADKAAAGKKAPRTGPLMVKLLTPSGSSKSKSKKAAKPFKEWVDVEESGDKELNSYNSEDTLSVGEKEKESPSTPQSAGLLEPLQTGKKKSSSSSRTSRPSCKDTPQAHGHGNEHNSLGSTPVPAAPTRRSQRQHTLSVTFEKDFLTCPSSDPLNLSPREGSLGYIEAEAKPIPNTVLPFWDARTVADIHESDDVDELVHCCCDLKEESGLMIQCEVCLTWQHGMCFNIDTEDDVPESYVCFACKNPKLVRESCRYHYDQEWLKKGRMATFNFIKSDENGDTFDSQQSLTSVDQMRSTNQLLAAVLDVMNVLRSLRYKLKLLREDNHPDLKFWAEPWLEKQEEPQVHPIADVAVKEVVVEKPTPLQQEPTFSSLKATESDMLGDILSLSTNILEGSAPMESELKNVPDDISSELKIDGDLINFITSTDVSPAARSEEEEHEPTAAVDSFPDCGLQLNTSISVGPENRPEIASENENDKSRGKSDAQMNRSENHKEGLSSKVQEMDEDSQSTIVDDTPYICPSNEVDGQLLKEINAEKKGLSSDARKQLESNHLKETSSCTPTEVEKEDKQRIQEKERGSDSGKTPETELRNEADTLLSASVGDKPFFKKCRQNLLNHVLEMQEKLFERLGLIESKVTELESEMGFDGSDEAEEKQDLIQFKDSVKGLYKDLDTVRKMTLCTN